VVSSPSQQVLWLGIILAEKEKIPLILSLASDVNELVNSLRTYARVKIIV